MPPSASSNRPGLRAVRAGERAALVTEQLALEQLARQRRAVDLDEGRPSPRGVSVDRPGDELLADAGLAADEHGDVGPGRLLDDLLDLAHLRAHQQGQLGVQTVVGGLEGRRGPLGTGPAGRGADRGLQIVRGVGPTNDVVGAGLDRFHDLRAGPGVRHHDHRAALGERRCAADEVDAGHPGQTNRDQREGEARLTDGVERLLGGGHGVRRVAPVRELRDHPPLLIRIALDDQRVPVSGERRGRRRGGPFETGNHHRVSFVRTGYLSARGMPNAFAGHFTRVRVRCRSFGRLNRPTLRRALPDCSKGLSLIRDACH